MLLLPTSRLSLLKGHRFVDHGPTVSPVFPLSF
jgi:hypothetical protein